MQDTQHAEEIKLGRRQLMVGASLAGVIATMPEPAKAEDAETPVMRLYHKWRVAFDHACEPCNDEDEVDRRSKVYGAIEDQMMLTPSQNAKDLFAKVSAGAGLGEWAIPFKGTAEGDVLWAEIEAALEESEVV